LIGPRLHSSAVAPPFAGANQTGHTKVAFTLDHYGHVLPGMQEKASAKLEAILFGR
jgi:hypothetical protein